MKRPEINTADAAEPATRDAVPGMTATKAPPPDILRMGRRVLDTPENHWGFFAFFFLWVAVAAVTLAAVFSIFG